MTCDSGEQFYFDIRLVNLAGDILARTIGDVAGVNSWPVSTPTVSCAGANVHSFLYINVGGTGKSDTSGNNSDCTY